MWVRKALLATGLVTMPWFAMAQPVDGLYVGAGAGGNIMSDQTLKSLTVPPALLPAVGGVIPLNGQRLTGSICHERSGRRHSRGLSWIVQPWIEIAETVPVRRPSAARGRSAGMPAHPTAAIGTRYVSMTMHAASSITRG